jgi:hypothetical protein
MLTIGASFGIGVHPDPRQADRPAPERATPPYRQPYERAPLPTLGTARSDPSLGFRVQQLLADAALDRAPPRIRTTLAAYRAHLADRIRYSGPHTPVDLMV